MNVSDVYVFKKVAATLSFAKAARQIGSSRSTVSKKIRRLEQDLGVVLLNRTTRSVSLTEAGRTFHEHTIGVDATIEHAADIVRGNDQQPNGTVAFTVPSTLGAALMPALITKFHMTWPDLNISVHFDDHRVDMIKESFDLAIRISKKLDDSSMISRRILSTRKVLAASPGYISKHGIPADISDLKNHYFLGLGSAVKTGSIWRIQNQEKPVEFPCTYAMSTNNELAIVLAACLDYGILYLPEICISNELRQHRLQIILPDCADPEPYGVYAVYPHRNVAAKVKELVKFLEKELSAVSNTDRWTPLPNDPSHSVCAANRN
jgi:DNA-binding transcriptional LysR family regulator